LATATATAAEATTAEAVTLVPDAAATLTAAQSAADGGPDGDDGSAAIAMQLKLEAITETKDIGIQGSDAVLQPGVGYRVMMA
jgi:hypothetical protein